MERPRENEGRPPGRSYYIQELAEKAGLSEQDYMLMLLNKHGTVAAAARAIGVNPSSIKHQCGKYGIRCETRRTWFIQPSGRRSRR